MKNKVIIWEEEMGKLVAHGAGMDAIVLTEYTGDIICGSSYLSRADLSKLADLMGMELRCKE